MAMDIKILYNIGLWRRNGHSRMREINIIWFIGATLCPRRELVGHLAKPKTFSPLKC
jgi:hypothetical protein